MGLQTIVYAQKFISSLFKPKKCTFDNQEIYPLTSPKEKII